MAYFPFFMDVSSQNGLIVGGGAVALRKIQKLLPYGARLTVCAPELLPEIVRIPGLTLLRRSFDPSMLDGTDYVIAATDDAELNHHVSGLCQTRGIPVNAVDDRDACTFLFPALVKRGDLSIGISTGGASPSAAIYLKEQIGALLPENFGQLLEYLDGLRDSVKASLPNAQSRARFFSLLFDACIKTGWPLSETQLHEIFLDASNDGVDNI